MALLGSSVTISNKIDMFPVTLINPNIHFCLMFCSSVNNKATHFGSQSLIILSKLFSNLRFQLLGFLTKY